MICCEKCFNDVEVKAVIKGLNQKGTCELCKKRNVHIYDTDVNNELADMFDNLLNIYTVKSELPSDYPRENINLLKDELCNRWNIFAVNSESSYRAITAICHERYEEHPELFDTPIAILQLNDKKYLDENSIIKTFEWQDFVDAIKTKNRFHTDYVNKDVLYLFCDAIKKTHKVGEIFYRARICKDETGFPISDMGAPKPEYATAGRANSAGISCLYLADDSQTTFNEIRAGAFDFVAVGRFMLKKNIEVVNLTSVDQISPFWVDNVTLHAVNKKHLCKISEEIAKPLRRHDSPLDYLPTQYISDFIKSRGFSGIEYNSTINVKGYNLAIFDQELFECVDVDVYDIKGLKYEVDHI